MSEASSAAKTDREGASWRPQTRRYALIGLVFTIPAALAVLAFFLIGDSHLAVHHGPASGDFAHYLYAIGLFSLPIFLFLFILHKGLSRDRDAKQRRELELEIGERSRALERLSLDLEVEVRKHDETARALALQVAALEAAANAVAIMDWEGRITWINAAFTRLTGYSREEAIGRSFSLLKSETYDEGFYASVQGVILSGRVWRGELMCRRKDGSLYAEEMTITPMRNEGGQITDFIALHSDITKRKHMEEALRQSEERFRRFASSISDIIYRYDPFANRFEFVSPSFAQRTGYSMQEITRDPSAFMARITHPEDSERVFATLESHIQQGPGAGALKSDYRLKGKDGSTFWVSDRKDFEFGPDGRLVCINGVMSDVNERVLAEEDVKRHRDRLDELVKERTAELRSVNEQLRQDIYERKRAEVRYKRLATAVEQSAEVIFITDTRGAIQYVNPAFERTTGYTQDEVVGKRPSILKSGRHDKDFYKDLWDTISEGKVWSRHIINKRKDGKEWEEEATISPVRDTTGRISNYVAVARDVTQEVAMEKQLRQAQRLESIGQLAAGIAHEINTPTQYVGDNTRFLQQSFGTLFELHADTQAILARYETLLPKEELSALRDKMERADLEFLLTEIPQAIKQTLDGVERVTEIVRAMKEFSHPGSEERKLINLNASIQSTLAVARNEYKYVADVTTDFDDTLPAVKCLPGELNQVFLNLFVNAAHAIAERNAREGHNEKGSIRVSTRAVENWVEVRIGDTGAGIPEAIRHKIFDPFFTTKEVGKGTGQGLSIAHNVIVEKHKGTITVDSEVGVGTTFLIRLPASAD